MAKQNVTLQAVASEAGCSVAVASTVLNSARGNTVVSDMLRKHVLRVAEDLGYQRRRPLRVGHIGVLLKNSRNDPYNDASVFEFLLGINDGLQEVGKLMTMLRLTDVLENADLAQLQCETLDGLIVVSSFPVPIQKRIEAHIDRCIWLDTSYWDANACLRRDELAVGELAVNEMSKCGYERLVYLSNPDHDEISRVQTHYSHYERVDGAKRAALSACVELTRCVVPWAVSGEPFPDLRKELRPGTGVIAYNSRLAERLVHYCAAEGLRPGSDFGLASCDLTRDQQSVWPELCGCRFPRYEMGLEAASMMLSACQRPNRAVPSRKLMSTWRDGATA